MERRGGCLRQRGRTEVLPHKQSALASIVVLRLTV